MGTRKTIAASAGISLLGLTLGCGVVAIPIAGPSISQVLPQTVAAGTNGITMKIVGTNFTKQAVILWNGKTLPTAAVDANTLAAPVASSSLATPSVVQLQVQDPQTGKESAPVPLTVTAVPSGGSSAPLVSALSITTTSLAADTVGVSYSEAITATGGTPGYTWSVSSGQLPAGMSLSATSGILSGTPTARGTFSFGVTVSDAGSPAQSSTAALTMTVNAGSTQQPSQLAIVSTALPGATAQKAYSGTLAAAGGTGPYTWSISSGQLPLGLSINSATGVISGIPAITQALLNQFGGTSSFAITATDSSNPAQTVSITTSISVGPASVTASLTVAIPSLPSGNDGTAYSSALQANGGTPSYTWSISGGSLPAGLTLAATTGVISGTPTATGTSSFTATVSDNGSPEQTQTVTASITIAAALPVGPSTTWYVRPDGGTRYSTNVTTGQCDGKADLPYPGTGTNQHCAFNDVRMLWQDGSRTYGDVFPGWGWVIAGGDTVIIRGSIASGVTYRVGLNANGTWCDTTGCWGIAGDPFDSGAPPPPSGTAAQHTRILGENYAACTSQSARTQLHGGWGALTVLNLTGVSYVDVACLDITDFSNCGWDADTYPCEIGGNILSDFATNGIRFNNTSTNITLTDLRVHGLGSNGLYGAPGGGVVATDIALLGNASSGWNTDDGSGTTGMGTLLVQNFDISWNGCVEEYPIVDTVPYFSCSDQSSGGYGDGFGTASLNSPAPGWQVHFDNGVVSYNTQDGLDALHIGGAGSTMTITRTLAYGNMGQQFKAGGSVATIQNNVIIGNCEALMNAIPGTPAGYNARLTNFCRAGDTAVAMSTTPGTPATFQDNTLFTAGYVGVEIEYSTADFGPTNVFRYNNNVFIGYYNNGHEENPVPIYSNGGVGGTGGTSAFPAVVTNPGGSWSNNSYTGAHWVCPEVAESNALCTDPGLADETYHSFGYGNVSPASAASAVVGAGISLPSITLDYTGLTRKNPPSIGAYDAPSTP